MLLVREFAPKLYWFSWKHNGAPDLIIFSGSYWSKHFNSWKSSICGFINSCIHLFGGNNLWHEGTQTAWVPGVSSGPSPLGVPTHGQQSPPWALCQLLRRGGMKWSLNIDIHSGKFHRSSCHAWDTQRWHVLPGYRSTGSVEGKIMKG